MADEKEQDDKTEEPTERRLQQALEKGDVAKSTEVNTFFLFASAALILLMLGPWLSSTLALGLVPYLGNTHEIRLDGGGLSTIGWDSLELLLIICGVPFAGFVLAGIASSMVQHKFVFTAEQLKPKLNRISPIAGFKRVYGKEALVQFIKGLLKIGLAGAAVSVIIWNERGALASLPQMDVQAIMPVIGGIALKLVATSVVMQAFLAVLDYGYQRWQWYTRQRMTREEMKQEFKETEGSPEIKQKIRRLRNEAAKKRMMASVPKASVIITNPTHYAVALRYESGMNAPICLAKGVDALAMKIREVAGEHDIPIVENPPLARAIHASVNIDEEIKSEHYKAVAEVIGYVLRLKKTRR
jgi:flagellar biosynthesis protein FlhB